MHIHVQSIYMYMYLHIVCVQDTWNIHTHQLVNLCIDVHVLASHMYMYLALVHISFVVLALFVPFPPELLHS